MATTQIKLGVDGDRVILEFEGKVLRLPWEAADEIAKALIVKARVVEEQIKALGIAKDDAILLRLGAPLGLSNNPDIRAEAEQLAQQDPQLRRYLPGGVRSKEHFGTPTLIRHAPRGGSE